MESGRSFKLGVIRLTERFVKSDPISAREERKLVRHIDADVDEHIERIKRAGFDRVVGTSGTILSLGAIAARTPWPRRDRHAAQPPRLGQAAAPGAPHDDVAQSRETRARAGTRAAARRPRRRPARCCSTRWCAASAPKNSRSATCRCAKASSSITSRGTGRKSRRPIAIRTSAGAASSSSPSDAATGRSTRSRLRSCRRRCSIRRGRSTASPTRSASGWNTRRSCTTSACTSATNATTSTPST